MDLPQPEQDAPKERGDADQRMFTPRASNA
jgi:hypothetical protein